GEPATPDDPAQGLVWRAIVTQVDQVGSESDFVSVADTPRTKFSKHPWSIGGGGVSDLKDRIDQSSTRRLEDCYSSAGFMAIPGDEDVFILEDASASQSQGRGDCIPLVAGESIRDWCIDDPPTAIYPYDNEGRFVNPVGWSQHFWKYRTLLAN